VQGTGPLLVKTSVDCRCPAPASGSLIVAASAVVWQVVGPGCVVVVGAGAPVVEVVVDVEVELLVVVVSDCDESPPPHAAAITASDDTSTITPRRIGPRSIGGETVTSGA